MSEDEVSVSFHCYVTPTATVSLHYSYQEEMEEADNSTEGTHVHVGILKGVGVSGK